MRGRFDTSHVRRLLSAALFLVGLLFAGPALAQIDQYTVGVDGMACPFCAYGIEKKLKALEGVSSLEIHIEKGTVDVSVGEGKTVTPDDIQTAIQEAGFELRDLEIRGKATLTDADPPKARFTDQLSLPIRGDIPGTGERTVRGMVSRENGQWTLRLTETGGGP
ncbi:MAG: heavy-metal-associated domain-containing protein [Bradymonadaceae bacterium]